MIQTNNPMIDINMMILIYIEAK